MPETRKSKRRKLETAEARGQKRKTAKKKDTLSELPKKRKVEESAGPRDEDDILKAFDLNPKFGPCIGISRLDRWKRAMKFGLNPPVNVQKILEKFYKEDKKNKCLWNGRV